jgi:catechol 2,3-dioxygenase-like lactoylglutathione lyase family enzyme
MIARLHAVVIDCPDPASLAQFYAAITGWEITDKDPDWHDLSGPDGSAKLSFQRAEDHQPPRWPDPNFPQQFHLDFKVDDVDEAERQILELGAMALPTPPGAQDFRVYADPAGHPFCLCF